MESIQIRSCLSSCVRESVGRWVVNHSRTRRRYVLTLSYGQHSALAAVALKDVGYQQVAVFREGMQAWRQAGLPLEQGLSGVISPPTDMLAMGTEHNWTEAMHYLHWEEELGKKYEPPHA